MAFIPRSLPSTARTRVEPLLVVNVRGMRIPAFYLVGAPWRNRPLRRLLVVDVREDTR